MTERRQTQADKASWEAERRDIYQERERELRELETTLLEDVKRQVAELEAAYDFVRPPAVPRCVGQEDAVVACYRKELDDPKGDVLRCASLVDAYTDCARQVASDLAKAVSAKTD